MCSLHAYTTWTGPRHRPRQQNVPHALKGTMSYIRPGLEMTLVHRRFESCAMHTSADPTTVSAAFTPQAAGSRAFTVHLAHSLSNLQQFTCPASSIMTCVKVRRCLEGDLHRPYSPWVSRPAAQQVHTTTRRLTSSWAGGSMKQRRSSSRRQSPAALTSSFTCTRSAL